MNIKDNLRLLLPPILYKIKNSIFPKSVEPYVSEKEYASMYFNEIQRRSVLDFTDVEELAKDIDVKLVRSITTTSEEPVHYGSFFSIIKYINKDIYNIIPPKGFYLQHGIVYELTDWMKRKKEGLNFVWSSHIKHLYSEITDNKHIYPVGASFFYAEPLLSPQQILEEKKRLGKNLLAFPLHSTYFYDMNYDSNNFIKLLLDQKKRFDTVRVCLYWKDVQKGAAKAYRDAGIECVCCGHINDLLFLQRQRTFFEIADATISNGLGSYIGYSIYLNKPHWLLPEEFDVVDTNGNESDELRRIANEMDATKRIYKAFWNNSAYHITQEQRDIVNELWGIEDMKTPDELYNLLISLYE